MRLPAAVLRSCSSSQLFFTFRDFNRVFWYHFVGKIVLYRDLYFLFVSDYPLSRNSVRQAWRPSVVLRSCSFSQLFFTFRVLNRVFSYNLVEKIILYQDLYVWFDSECPLSRNSVRQARVPSIVLRSCSFLQLFFKFRDLSRVFSYHFVKNHVLYRDLYVSIDSDRSLSRNVSDGCGCGWPCCVIVVYRNYYLYFRFHVVKLFNRVSVIYTCDRTCRVVLAFHLSVLDFVF